MNKINFYKFIWGVLENEKKNWMNIIFGTFSSSQKCVKKK